MEPKEKLTIQEIEQLCQAYIDCQLSRLQEKELELVLLCSDLTSPIIAEIRTLMGLSTLMSTANSNAKAIKKVKPPVFRYIGIAVSIVIIAVCTGYFFRISRPTEITPDVYACVDGKVMTGYAAQIVVNATEQETMNMFRSIIEDVEYEQCLSEQYMNSIMN